MPRFLTDLELRDYDSDEWVVLSPLRYIDDAVGTIEVPRGFITDLASIPPGLRGIFNVNGRSRKAAVIHDYLYCSQGLGGMFSRAICDRIFLNALQVLGVGLLERYAMWSGVRLGGWYYWRKRVDMLRQNFDFVPFDYDWSKP